MARSVKIKTPIPTLEEFGKKLGLSKARRRTLAPVFIERRADGVYAVRKRGTQKASYIVSTQKEAVDRAREIIPDRTILIERVREGTRAGKDSVGLDKWLRA